MKDWNKLGDNIEIPRASAAVSKYLLTIIDLVNEYIKKINLEPWDEQKKKTRLNDEEPSSIIFNPEDMSSLFSVNTFLEILKSTLILGFWPSM